MSEQGTPTIELSEPRRPATAPGPTASPRRDGASKRAAHPRADVVGRGGARPRRRASGSPRARSRASPRRPAAAPRSCAARCKLAEAMAVIPLARRSLPEARLPFEDVRVLLAAVAASAAGGMLRRRGEETSARRARASRRRSACCPRRSPCAAPTCPPTTPSSTSRSAPTSRAVRPDGGPEGARALRLASRGAAARPRRSPASCVVERLFESPGRVERGAAGLAAVSLAVELFAWCERNPDSPIARAVRRPGTEIQRLIAHPRADRRSRWRSAPRRWTRSCTPSALAGPGPPTSSS